MAGMRATLRQTPGSPRAVHPYPFIYLLSIRYHSANYVDTFWGRLLVVIGGIGCLSVMLIGILPTALMTGNPLEMKPVEATSLLSNGTTGCRGRRVCGMGSASFSPCFIRPASRMTTPLDKLMESIYERNVIKLSAETHFNC